MSIFLEAEKRPVNLTLALIDTMTENCKENPDKTAGEALMKAWGDLGYKQKMDRKTLAALAQRLKSMQEDSGGDSKGKMNMRRSLGTDLMKWIAGLKGDQICLYLAGWDWRKARWMYFNLDYADINAAVEGKVELEWNRLQSNFEASMYGFGGHYDGDKPGKGGGSSGNVVDLDMARGSGEGLSQMRGKLKL